MIMSEPCYVYILKCSDDTHYTGITNDLGRRLTEHEHGQSKSTRHKRPVTVLWSFVCQDRKAARGLEVKIKRSGAAQFLKTYGLLRNEV